MHSLESTIEKIEAQVTDDESRQELLRALKARLAEMQQAAHDASVVSLQNKNSENWDPTETDSLPEQLPTGTQLGRGGTNPQPEQLATGTQVGQRASDPAPTETHPLPCDSHANRTDLDWDAIDAKLAALPEDLRDVAEHLQERINHRSPFARLTTDERKTILQLIADHTGPEVVRIVAEPPPIGFNIKTSKQALSRFKRDHMRYEMNEVREAQRLAAEEAHKAFEKAFSECISSNEAFCAATERNIKRRVFEATRNSSADYQEIRWLISSLAVLRKQYAITGKTPASEPHTPT